MLNQATARQATSRKERRRLAKQSRKSASTHAAPSGLSNDVKILLRDAEALRQAGRLDDAEQLCRQIVAGHPGVAFGHVALASLLQQRQRNQEAYEVYKQAVTVGPQEFEAWRRFAGFLDGLNHHEAALIAWKNAIGLSPKDPDVFFGLGCTLRAMGHHQESAEAFEQALGFNPKFAAACLSIGFQHQILGDFDKARTYYNRTLEIDANAVEPLLRLTELEQSDAEMDASLKHLKRLLRSAKLPDEHRIEAEFATARILRRRRDHDGAFAHFAAGNDLRRKRFTFNRTLIKDLSDQTIAAFVPDVFEKTGAAACDTQSPVFIVGMPRSGSTLVEQIIAAHPDALAGGEDRKMSTLAESMVGHKSGGLRYPRDIAEIEPTRLTAVGADYLAHMAKLYPGAARITDKMLFNFFHLGLIAILFPKARIIHCKRDPMDTCLSCYFQLFLPSQGISFTNDLGDLGFYYRQYLRVMEHWRTVLPVPMLEIGYEDLIADQERHSRELIDFVGLEWNDACLEFHRSSNGVSTVSNWQVRQPIYNSSIGRWRKYEQHLEPLKRALNETD